MIFLEPISKTILKENKKMKTINKFSALLLLMTTIMLCSYVLMRKGSTDISKAIATPSTVEAGIGTLKFELDRKMNVDTTIKTRKASCACGQLTVTTKGPDPERRSLCHCKNCQLRTGSAFAIQARFPREQVTIEGKSTAWRFPSKSGKPVMYRSCDSEGAIYHFCPVCGATVYYLLEVAPDFVGIRVGAFTDPTFPAPNIAGFEEYMFPWANNVSALPMPGGHHQ
jgi:hypothetical protein